jgi:hypothetical protein
MKNKLQSTLKQGTKVLSMKKSEALSKARAVKARNLEIGKTISKASSVFSLLSFIYSIKDYIKLVFNYFYNSIVIILNSKYFYIFKLLIKLWVVSSLFFTQSLWLFGYSSLESYDIIFSRLLYFTDYLKEYFLSIFYPELIETRKYLTRIREINSHIDNLNISDSMKSRLKSNLISKYNSSSLNWSITNSEDIETLLNLADSSTKSWYDMFTSPYFYYTFAATFCLTGCYFFPEYTIYPVMSYFGLPVNQTWEEIWRWFLDRGPQPPTTPDSSDSINIRDNRTNYSKKFDDILPRSDSSDSIASSSTVKATGSKYTPFEYVEVDNLSRNFKHRNKNYFSDDDSEEWNEWLIKYHSAHHSNISFTEFIYKYFK